MSKSKKHYTGEFKYKENQLEYVVQAKKPFNWWACCLLPLLLLLLLLLVLFIYFLLQRYTPPINVPDDVDPEIFHHPVQVRLFWHNADDLDLAVVEPGDNRIFYSDKENTSTTGSLNYDMNVSDDNTVNDPSEHISWRNVNRMREGVYQVQVTNYKDRTASSNSYRIDLVQDETVYRFDIPNSPEHEEQHVVVKYRWTRQSGITVLTSIVDPVVTTLDD